GPIVQKECTWFFVRHVMVDRDDVDVFAAKTLENRLEFVFEYGEIPVDRSVVVSACKGRPGIDAHFLCHGAAAWHFDLATDDHFEHAVVSLSLCAKDFVDAGA